MMDLFQIGVDVMSTSVSKTTRKILAQTGNVNGEGRSDSDNVEWWQHVGFASRPAKPEKGKQAAQCITIRNGTIDCAVASQDMRGLAVYGELADGETCIYATGEDGKAQARVLLKANGSINLYTRENNASDGKGMGVFINPDGSVSIASHNGAAVLIGTDESIKIFNKSGGVQVLPDGSIKLASGAKIDISGAAISLGGPAGLPVALGPNVVTAITNLQLQLTQITAALAALGALSGPVLGVMIQGIVGPLATPLALNSAAVLAANALIPSLRTTSD